VTVTGTSGSITETASFTLAVSAGVGKTGIGTQVDLSSEFNLNGIYTDGSTYTTGGIDGAGYSYSANLLTGSRTYNSILFNFGEANLLDAVGCGGQVVSLPQGKFSSLLLFATGVEGNQPSQTLTVTYTDGTSAKFVQSFSDWFTPEKYLRESEAVAMAYRNFDNGTKDQRTFNLYEYQFALNSQKTVKSLTLPANSHVVVLAETVKLGQEKSARSWKFGQVLSSGCLNIPNILQGEWLAKISVAARIVRCRPLRFPWLGLTLLWRSGLSAALARPPSHRSRAGLTSWPEERR